MSRFLMKSRKWAVIGAGPCGIGVVGRLLDLGQQVTWIDPAFEVGRMGPFYRNVPANTLNVDLIVAAKLCDSFKFDETQQKRRDRGEVVMADLPPLECSPLGYLVDFLEDSTVELKKHVNVVQGRLTSLQKESIQAPHWTYHVVADDGHEITGEVDGVINVTGCKPVSLPGLPSVVADQNSIKRLVSSGDGVAKAMTFHSLDQTVNPEFIKSLLHDNLSYQKDRWVVVGASHSGMLVVKNLAEAGVDDITVIHRSPLRFMTLKDNGCKKYQGTGLKGPVGDWVRHQLAQQEANNQSQFQLKQFDPTKSFDQQLWEVQADHVVSAIGFVRDDIFPRANEAADSYCHPFNVYLGPPPSHEARRRPLSLVDYDKWNGALLFTANDDGQSPRGEEAPFSLGIYGGGIAYPQNHRDEEGEVEPWVGFKRSIEQTDLMLEAFAAYQERL